MLAIKTTGLGKRYGSLTAVNDVNLEIIQGELFCLLGINGAGKTTLIKMLSCLTAPTEGDAVVGGYSIVHEARRVKHLIGVSPQETAVAPNLTVQENLALIGGLHSLSRKEMDLRISELCQQLNLSSVLQRKAGKLSGGWQRRVSIAMALISRPQILFLDEPTLGLDVIARHSLWEMIRSLKGSVTILLTTHYMEEAEALCDRVGIMQNGRLITTDTVAQLCSKTNTDTLASAFVSVIQEDLL